MNKAVWFWLGFGVFVLSVVTSTVLSSCGAQAALCLGFFFCWRWCQAPRWRIRWPQEKRQKINDNSLCLSMCRWRVLETTLHLNSFTAAASAMCCWAECQPLLEDGLSIASQTLLYLELKPAQQEEKEGSHCPAEVLPCLVHNLPLAMQQQQLPRQ